MPAGEIVPSGLRISHSVSVIEGYRGTHCQQVHLDSRKVASRRCEQ
jgi:hypothetical protein